MRARPRGRGKGLVPTAMSTELAARGDWLFPGGVRDVLVPFSCWRGWPMMGPCCGTLCTRVSHRRSQVELPVRWRFRPRGFGSASGRWRRCGNLSVDWVQRRENFQTNWCLSLPLRTCSCLYCLFPFPLYSYRPSLASLSPSFSPSPSVVSHLAVFVFKK